ncbi:MAG: Anaphase-promoting complex subunit 5 [Vezdaea aestivalis]|nr:MAG: Anaphase-promoting complex subunit 5 [Vezdaea aestivalis]
MRPSVRYSAPGFLQRSLNELKRSSHIVLSQEGIKGATTPYELFKFAQPGSIDDCKIMGDADLGGFSTSSLDYSPRNEREPSHARFHGNISVKLPTNRPNLHRSGYAGWRTLDQKATLFGRSFWDIDPYRYLALRVKSDGRKYFVNLQTDSIVHTDIHQHRLLVRRPGQWETVYIKWHEFVRTNYGQIVEPQSEMLREKVKSIGTFNHSANPRQMTRFLTPAKIGLLSLITLYHENVVPTAASIPLLSFVIGQILAPHSTSPESIESFEATDFSSLGSFQEVTASHASVKPGRTIWDLLLDKLWEINSFDGLHVFFDNLARLMIPTRERQLEDEENGIQPLPTGRTRLSKMSPLGVFVRRAQLEFMRTQFHDSMALWHNFTQFRQPTLHTWAKRHPQADKTYFDINLNGLDFEIAGSPAKAAYGVNTRSMTPDSRNDFVSTDDVEKLLEFQIEVMQRTGARVPIPVKGKLQSLVRNSPTPPSVSHYMTFLDSWRSGDYPSSFDHLHRYFDYTMHNKDRTFYQYALLNLAILQAEFGCFTEAVAAMHETISTARENKDMGCLNFSLSWLYHFSKTHPQGFLSFDEENVLGPERDALNFLRVKAKETGMFSLWSTSLLGEGESIASAFENILRSSHLNISKGVENIIGSQLLVHTSIWSRLGVACLSLAFCETFQDVYWDQSPLDDQLKLTCRLANLFAVRGQPEKAILLMNSIDAESLRTLKTYQYWTVHAALLKLKRELRKGNLDACDHLLTQLRSQPLSDRDICFEVMLLEIELLTKRRSLSDALSMTETYATEIGKQNADIYHQIKILIFKASLLKQCGQIEKGFSAAVRAARIAWRARLLPLLWEASCAIADILLALSEFEGAAKIVAAVMPHLLEGEDGYAAGTGFSILADAQVGLAGRLLPGSTRRKEHLTQALEYLDRGFYEFTQVEDTARQREMVAKKATLLRVVGETILATDCAARYLALKG